MVATFSYIAKLLKKNMGAWVGMPNLSKSCFWAHGTLQSIILSLQSKGIFHLKKIKS
jgi:hypothetical protein